MRRTFLLAILLSVALHAVVWIAVVGKTGSPATRLPAPDISWIVESPTDTLGTEPVRVSATMRRAVPPDRGSARAVRPAVRATGSVEARVVMQWPKGVKRTRVYGSVPVRFTGVDRSQRIVLELTVSPRGQVVGVRVASGGTDPRALSLVRDVVRGWRFAPLRAAALQRDLVCVVTWTLRATGAAQRSRRP